VFRLLANELRSPASVIAGYARMLGERRLDGGGQVQALAQIERAASRISRIGRQAAALARWLGADHRGTRMAVSVGSLIARAIAASGSPDLRVDLSAENKGIVVQTFDHDSLPEAVGSLIDAVSREHAAETVRVVVRAADPPAGCDILVGPSSRFPAPDEISGPDDAAPFALDRRGQVLSLVVAAAIFSAHNSRLWMVGHPPRVVGVRLLAAAAHEP
jgi:signal transduction histidine kinase